MNGFGFIEYKDPMDARDVVPGTFASFLHCLAALEIVCSVLTRFLLQLSVRVSPNATDPSTR